MKSPLAEIESPKRDVVVKTSYGYHTKPCSPRRWGRDFWNDANGASTIECAVLFATVIACISLGIYSLGEMSKSSFGVASDAMVKSPTQSAGAAGQTESIEFPKGPGPVGPHWPVYALGGAFLVGAGAPLAFIVFRMNKQPREDEKEDDQEEPAPTPSETDLAFEKRQQIRRVFSNNMSSLLKGQLKARHIMSRQVTCIPGTTRIDDVSNLFESKKVGHVLVSDRSGKLVGIISHEDMIQREGKTAADVMTSKPYTLNADSDVSIGITELICRRISCLPITSKEGGIKGIITKTDFLLAFQCAIQTLGGVVDQLQSTEHSDGNSVRTSRTADQLSSSEADSTVAV